MIARRTFVKLYWLHKSQGLIGNAYCQAMRNQYYEDMVASVIAFFPT